MANITVQDINNLRKRTGVGIMDCKKALIESDGDVEKAIDYLREKGQKLAVKRADRAANEGVVLAKTTQDKTFGAVVMINCETDFVANNQDFIAFVQSVMDAAVNAKAKTIEEVNQLEVNGTKVETLVIDQLAKIGEKITLSAYKAIEAPVVYSYIHPGNRTACVVGLNKTGFDEVGKNINFQIVSMKPEALTKEDVPQEVIDNEMKVNIEKTKQEQVEKAVEAALKKAGINPAHVDSEDHMESNMAKGWITAEDVAKAKEIIATVSEEKRANLNENMIQNIAKGRLEKFFKESTLLSQEYFIDNKKTVAEYLKSEDADLAVTAFARLELGA
ncbi:elongation factor Ts [bacterium]|nr:elongation factor Ts [Bacteroidales bacterium]MBR1680756.1 elongation factor Ts [bacterium]